MRLISTLKRTKYIGAALVLLFAAMPVNPIATWIVGSNKASAIEEEVTEVSTWSELVTAFSDGKSSIKLMDNIEVTSTEEPDGLVEHNALFDMNGHSVTFSVDKKFKADGASLTITGGGSIIKANDSDFAVLSIENGGSAVLQNGTITATVFAVDVWGGSFTIDDGTIESGVYGVEVTNGTFNMNGGKIESGALGVTAYTNSVVNIYEGTIEAGYYGIASNGTAAYGGSKINVSGGTINATELGIFAPHYNGETTISGGIITGKTGIEIRAGDLTVTGGTITSNASAYVVEPAGSGFTTEGAAIAVAQHTTRQPINVNISGGSFTGPVAFSQRDPQEGEPVDETTSITGGKFLSTSTSKNAVEVDDETRNLATISGGTFSDPEVALDKLAEGKTVYKVSDTEYVVDTAPSYELPARIMMEAGTYTFDGLKDDVVAQKYGKVEAHYHDYSSPAPVFDKAAGTLTSNREVYGAANLTYDIYESVGGVVTPTDKYNQKVVFDTYSVNKVGPQYVKMGTPITNLEIKSKMTKFGNDEFTSIAVATEYGSVATISENADGTYTLTGVKPGSTKIYATITDIDGTVEPQIVELGTVYVWNLVKENFVDNYDLGNLVTKTPIFKVYDEGGSISTVVKDASGNPVSDIIVQRDDTTGRFRLKGDKNTRPGLYKVEFIDTVGGEVVDRLTTTVRVHSINITGSSEHYIVMTRDPSHQDQNRLNLNVVEENGFTENRDITVSVGGLPVDGLTPSYQHLGNWRLTGNEAGSYTVTFSDGYASADYKVFVMKFTFGQDSYHVRLAEDEPYIAVNAFNQYWHDINAAEHRLDTYFKVVKDEGNIDVTNGYVSMKMDPAVSGQGEDYRFYWCEDDDNCLSAGNYTIHYSADANGGSVAANGKTATKNVRLHIYNMVAPDYGTRYTTVDKTIDVDVYDENERGSVTATIEAISGDADGLSFATSGFWPWTTTDYTRLEANKPGVYMVHYTDRMANGEIVGTYDLRVVVIEVEEQTLLVAEGETIDITGSADWSASYAVDATSGEEYTAEDGVIKFDTTGMELGRHEVSVAHDFEEYEEEGYPVARETVKKVNVVVYKISSDPVSDPEEVTGDTIKELLDTLNEEGLADDLLESNFWRLWNMTSREDVQALFGPSRSEAFETLMNLRNAIIEGQEVSTFVDVRELTEDEVEAMVDEQLKDLVKVMDSEGNVTYYDVNIFLMVNEDIVGLLHQLNNPITVCLGEVEGPADGYSRQFTVLRQHAGEAPEIMVEGLKADGGFFIENGKLYIVSSKFSQYAVFYEDTLNPIPAPKAPETGDTMKSSFGVASVNLSVAIIAIITAISLAGAAVVAKRK